MKNLIIAAFTFIIFTLSQFVQADEVFKSFSESRFDSFYKFNYFKTESNFNSDGSQQSLPSGYSFQVIDLKLQARYVLLEDLGLYGGFSIGNSEANDILATRKNSSLNYFHLGADYLFYQSQFMSFYADLSYSHAVEKIVADTDSAMNSDGASELHAEVVSLFDFDYVQPFAALGLNYRLEGLSTLLTYSLGLQTSLAQFVIGGALNGFVSVVDDKNTNSTTQREIINNRVNATSKKFNSINPNYLEADLYAKYIYDENFSMQLNAGYSVMGSNSALGYHIGAAFTWGFGGEHTKTSKSIHSSQPKAVPIQPKNTQQPVKKFQEDTSDGVNQDYFKPVTPAPDNYIQKIDTNQTSSEDESDFNVKTKKAPPANDNEYRIKLKKKKKKN